MKINRKIVAFMAVFLLIPQILGTSFCLAEMNGEEASLTGKIYERGVDTDHNGKFDYLEVSVEISVTTPGEYQIQIDGLTDSNHNFISINNHTSAYLSVGVHLLNLSFYGPTIYVSKKNPSILQYIGLLKFREYQLFTKFFGFIDSRWEVNLTRVYNYNEFDAPFKDIEARLTIDPDGQVHLAGTLNYTHMEPSNEMLGARGNARITKNGNLTSVSANCTFVASPEIASEFPYNSTSFSWLEEYSNGDYRMGANATATLPVGIASQFPFNATDLSLKSIYSNAAGLLNTEINASTILPENIVPQYVGLDLPLLNSTDFTIQGQYSNNSLMGTITIHMLSGFPLGDLKIDFQGNETDLFLTGNVKVIYNIPIYPLNKTTLEQMLIYLNSTIPGYGSSSLYEMTNGTLACSYLNTNMTPYDSIGVNVDFNASIHGDFTEALVFALSSLLGDMNSPEMRELMNSALNATVSSVKSASFQIAYTHISREISIRLTFVDKFLNIVKDLSTLFEEIPFYPPYPPSPPIPSILFSESSLLSTTRHSAFSTSSLEMMQITWIPVALGSLMFLNATLPYVETAEIELTYARANKKLELEATAQAQFPEYMTQTLPEEIPLELKQLIESLQNTTYCKVKSSRESIVYKNGVADLKEDYVIEGDLNAEINFVKNVYFTYMNKTSILPESLTIINETMIDISNLKINFDYNETYATGDLEGLTVLPPKDPINATFFQLKSLLKITDTPNESPVQRERLKITVEGGSNVTHAVILHQPETVPPPNETSLDMRTMVWYNQSVSNLKDLNFEIKPQSYGITLAVNDQSGNPIPSASVSVCWPNGTVWKTLLTGDYGSTSSFNVDYGCMPFGTYNITATYHGVSRTRLCTINHPETYTISLPVNSPQIVINITNPIGVTPTNPITGDATQEAATILTIKQISKPVTIAVRNVTAPTEAPPSGTWKLLGNYVQIITNETTLAVNATIRIYYTSEQLIAAGVDEGSLKINYWDSVSSKWVSAEGQVNTAGHYVEAVITHFSVWTIMGQPGAAPAPIWTQPWFVGIIIGIIIMLAAAAAYVTVKKKPLQKPIKK